MIKKKICLLGAFSVGKTSLIKRFVDSIFDDKYITTIGVKIDKKALTIFNQDIHLMIWDLEGEDDYTKINTSYLRGASGYILVVDGTRADTLKVSLALHDSIQTLLGNTPAVLAMNKADLEEEWRLSPEAMNEVPDDLTVIRTSAKSGANVEEMFSLLSQKMLKLKE